MTKLKLFFMLSVLLGGLLLNTQTTAAQTAGSPPALFCSLAKDKDKVRHKSGPEVANKVKETRKTSKRVNDALAAFERNEKTSKRKPDIDAATSITFDIEKKSEAVAFLKASFTSSQGSMVPAGYVEIISIPAYSAPGEWQGTMLFYKYDPAGNLLDEYVADVILLPDPTYTHWDPILEVSFDYTGTYLEFGTESLYYAMGTPQGGWPATSRGSSKSQFKKAQFQPGRGQIIRRVYDSPRVKRVLKCTAIGCTGSAVGCGLASIFFAGAPFGPCMTQACGGSLGVCTVIEVFGP